MTRRVNWLLRVWKSWLSPVEDIDADLSADHLQLLTLFIQVVNPYVPSGQENPAVKYCQVIFQILGAIVNNFNGFTPICERVCRCWRYMLISYRTAMQPLLP